MCAAFSRFTNTDLLTLSCTDNFRKIKKDFLIKDNFKIISLFKKPKTINLFIRIIILFKILNVISEQYRYIVSRSPFISVILSFLGYRNILELHHPNTGFTKLIFLMYKKLFKNKFQRFVLINKNINKELKISKKNFIVLDTCIDLKNFQINTKIKKNSCVYAGSLFEGKGFELVITYKILKNGISCL